MICDLCDKDQQSICERSFHFIKPINECLMRKAQENRQIIEELEKIKADIEELMLHYDYDTDSDFEKMYGIRRAIEILDNRIKELNNEN